MAQIFNFPNAHESQWSEFEAMLRECYQDAPDGPATIEECLPEIKNAWQETFVSFDVQPIFTIPGPLTPDQEASVLKAVEQGVNLVANKLKSERAKSFGKLASKIYEAAFWRRNAS